MKKIYLLTLSLLASATMATQAASPLMKDLPAPASRSLSLAKPSSQKKAPAKTDETITWGEWQPAGTGTFTIDDGLELFLGLEDWVGAFEGIKVYHRTSTENASSQQYKFEGIYNDATIIVDYDANTSLCKVLPQPTNIDAFGMPLDVVDAASVFEIYGEEWQGMSPEEIEETVAEYAPYTYYIPELGRFYLYLGYITEGIEDIVALTDCSFQFDGVADMSVTVDAKAFYKDISDMSATIVFPSSVAECRYGCFEGIMSQEKIDAVIHNDSGVVSINEAGKIDLTAKEGNGMYTIVAITFATNGTPLEWDYAEYTFTSSSSEGWTSLGEGEFKTDMFESLFDINIPAYKVEVQQNIDNPSLYRVVNPYGLNCPYPELSLRAEGFDIYLVFDTTNPDKVFFKPTNLGIDTGGEWWIAVNTGYFLEEIQGSTANASTFGKFKDGIISFPAKSVLTTCENMSIFGGQDGTWYYGNGSGTLSLTLPEGSAVDSMTTANSENKEYYNLQGVKVTAPAKGTMVIERNGSSVVKKVIR